MTCVLRDLSPVCSVHVCAKLHLSCMELETFLYKLARFEIMYVGGPSLYMYKLHTHPELWITFDVTS